MTYREKIQELEAKMREKEEELREAQHVFSESAQQFLREDREIKESKEAKRIEEMEKRAISCVETAISEGNVEAAIWYLDRRISKRESGDQPIIRFYQEDPQQ